MQPMMYSKNRDTLKKNYLSERNYIQKLSCKKYLIKADVHTKIKIKISSFTAGYSQLVIISYVRSIIYVTYYMYIIEILPSKTLFSILM